MEADRSAATLTALAIAVTLLWQPVPSSLPAPVPGGPPTRPDTATRPPAPSTRDSLNLVGRSQGVVHSIGVDVWEVWVCDVSEGRAVVDVDEAVGVLESELVRYFEWLSGGVYQPRFVAGGAAVDRPADELFPCESGVRDGTSGNANGVFVVTDHANVPPAFARPSEMCGVSCNRGEHYPGNGRVVVVGAHTVLTDSWNFEPKRAAHEIGHAIGWPHSFVGRRQGASEYDNPLDVMSGDLHRDGDLRGRPQGTLAINEYAAGWLQPHQVVVATSGTAEYLVGPVGHDGIRLIAILGNDDGTFVAIDVRVSAGYDEGLPAAGVTLHRIDQRSDQCDFPSGGGCYGHRRRTIPLVGQKAASTYAHVLSSGESAEGPGYRLTVIDRNNDLFRVNVELFEGRPAISTGPS